MISFFSSFSFFSFQGIAPKWRAKREKKREKKRKIKARLGADVAVAGSGSGSCVDIMTRVGGPRKLVYIIAPKVRERGGEGRSGGAARVHYIHGRTDVRVYCYYYFVCVNIEGWGKKERKKDSEREREKEICCVESHRHH